MTVYDYDIGIIGGGAAGLTVASGAAQLGAKTLLVEQEQSLGGDCLHYGCVPSKTLIRSAHVYHMMKQGEQFGLPQVNPPPVDFSQIASRIRSVIETIQHHDSVERFCGLGAQVEFGSPTFIDEHQIDLSGNKITAKSWVIATGSSPTIPRIPGIETVSPITNKEIFSLSHLPESMIILGAGPIATEMAQSFCRLGTKVSVIQRSGQILSKEDRDMADIAMRNLEDEGVTFYLNTTIAQVENGGPGKQRVIFTNKKGEEESVTAVALLVALGRQANTKDLGLEKIGVDFDHRGISIDKRMRTAQKHIYAPGDVNGAFQFTHAAGYEGGIVVSNAIFHLPRKADYTFMPWCTYTHPELASIGMNEKIAKQHGMNYSVWTEDFIDNDRALAENETTGKIKLILDNKELPIGVQIVGPHAGDLISEWIAMLNGKTKLSTLAGAVHPYPSFAEINKRVTGNLYSGKIFSETVKKGLKVFFRLKGGKKPPCSHLP